MSEQAVETPTEEPDDLRADLEAVIDQEDVAPEEPKAAEATTEKPETPYADDAEKYPTLNEEKMGKAPEGWRPAAREGWEKVDPALRREIHRRELDIAAGLQQASGARQVAERFDALAKEFAPVMQAQGVSDPLQAVQGLLGTARTLGQGTMQEKCQAIASLTMHYGVDASELDTVLTAMLNQAGGVSAQTMPANQQVPPEVAQQLAQQQQFIDSLQGRMNQEQQQSRARADQTVAAFQQNAEFLPDVRHQMADLMESAGRRGQPITIQQAYDLACGANPDIKAVMDQRAAQTATTTRGEHIAAKLAKASASITGHQTGAVAPAVGGSMRDDFNAAIESLDG